MSAAASACPAACSRADASTQPRARPPVVEIGHGRPTELHWLWPRGQQARGARRATPAPGRTAAIDVAGGLGHRPDQFVEQLGARVMTPPPAEQRQSRPGGGLAPLPVGNGARQALTLEESSHHGAQVVVMAELGQRSGHERLTGGRPSLDEIGRPEQQPPAGGGEGRAELLIGQHDADAPVGLAGPTGRDGLRTREPIEGRGRVGRGTTGHQRRPHRRRVRQREDQRRRGPTLRVVDRFPGGRRPARGHSRQRVEVAAGDRPVAGPTISDHRPGVVDDERVVAMRRDPTDRSVGLDAVRANGERDGHRYRGLVGQLDDDRLTTVQTDRALRRVGPVHDVAPRYPLTGLDHGAVLDQALAHRGLPSGEVPAVLGPDPPVE